MTAYFISQMAKPQKYCFKQKMTTDKHKIKKKIAPLRIAGVIACTFFYFLIFAQFAYLHLLSSFNASTVFLNISLLCMCAGGITGCLIVALKHQEHHSIKWLVGGFVSCAIWAQLVWLQSDTVMFPLLGFGIGVSLGILTVSIASTLHFWLPQKKIGIWVGGGVGGAYFLCNVPVIFQSSAHMHCLYAVGMCVIGLFLCKGLTLRVINLPKMQENQKNNNLFRSKKIWLSSLFLTILVWFDSAAFLLIQQNFQQDTIINNPETILWGNALLHLFAAIIAGWLLDKHLIVPLLIISLLGLLLGMWGIQNHNHYGWKMIYIVSVSIYSTVLVAFVALLQETRKFFPIKIKVALLFAIGGWLGSTIGIIMAYNLQKIPLNI